MSGNSFGRLFTVTTFGESHGPALGGIVDGCPPGLSLAEDDLQREVDRRRPGTSRFTSQRPGPRRRRRGGRGCAFTQSSPIGFTSSSAHGSERRRARNRSRRSAPWSSLRPGSPVSGLVSRP